ncbi:hypothetical protein J6590_102124 [Homalodisca vitripennis]|nr:hypothetical protein J6590_102124 [Homalodisca vitripennis]
MDTIRNAVLFLPTKMTKADEQRDTKKEECKVGRRGIAGLAQQRVRLTGDLATTVGEKYLNALLLEG